MLGEIPLAVMNEWAIECLLFFNKKAIGDNKKVTYILGGLQDNLVKAWYSLNILHITTLTWEEFIAEFKKEFLKVN